MRLPDCLWLPALAASLIVPALALDRQQQQPLASNSHAASDRGGAQQVTVGLFASLERLSRLVDISYCVGTTGISPPFSCASRCKEFPALRLVTTWNTGILLSDSCGYVAVDHAGPSIFKTASLAGAEPQKATQGVIIVAFRGTYSITNTVVDLSTVPQEYVPYPEPDDDENDGGRRGHGTQPKCDNCTVHMGFLASWRNARELVLPALRKARAEHPDYPIQLVGHSLGGAVAALAALEIKLVLGWDDITVTTFGEPRVGNKGLALFIDRVFDMEQDDGYDGDLEQRVYRRVTHVNDPVPLLPLTEWGFYQHAGEIFITKSDLSPALEDLRMCRGDWDTACSASDDTEALSGRLGRLVAAAARDGRDNDVRDLDQQGIPTRLKLWQLFFAHRDYFWRLGLCLPGGDPADWGREKYNFSQPLAVTTDEL